MTPDVRADAEALEAALRAHPPVEEVLRGLLARLDTLERAATTVIEYHEREVVGDPNLTGFEWGEAIRALAAALAGVQAPAGEDAP